MLTQYLNIQTATGVAITLAGDGTLTINACQVTANRNQLDITAKFTDLSTIRELAGHFPKKSLISLNLTGKGILHKQTEKVAGLTPNNFAQLLPNASLQDFYVQNFVSGDRSFISVIRKAEADRIIDQLRQEDLIPVMLSLGPFPVAAILPQLNVYDAEVVFDGHVLNRDEQSRITAYQSDPSARSPFPLKIESEKIEERLLLAYASAFQLILAPRLDPVQAATATTTQAYTDSLARKKLQAYGGMALIAVFLLLLVNFILFSWVSNDNAQMAYRVSRSAKSTEDIKGIQDQIKVKEQELRILGWDDGTNKAYLLDQMASCLPSEMTWKQVEVNPVDINQSRIQKLLVFKDRQIIVTGLSAKILPVNEWMARLKTQKWVKDIRLENYTLNTEKDSGQFTLTISY
ncbi:hypothetical protein ACFGVR_15430 [Mucilaginibacter sp. AW1-3]